jgi:hypothetical protein
LSTQAERQVPSSYLGPFEESSHGWIMFAGILILLIGTMNTIEGIAAIGNSHFFVGNAHYVFGDLKTWGWIALCIGVLQLLIGFGVFARNQVARWTGVLVLSLNALAQLLMIPAYPLLAVTIFAVDFLAIYALIIYGNRIAED